MFTVDSIKHLIQNGQFKKALSFCNQEIDTGSNVMEYLYFATICNRYICNVSEAIACAEKLTGTHPSYGRGFQECGHAYKLQGDNEKALIAYLEAVKRNPALISSWQNVNTLSLNATQRSTAEENIQYLTLLPKVLCSVISFIYEDKLSKAEKLCKHFLSENPKHVEAMRLLANVAEKLNVLDDSEVLLMAALEIEPENLWLKFDLINVLHRRQKFALAHTHASELSEAMPNDFSVKLALASVHP